jgi:glycosyltransferase involved in cell wall biosynthesis
VIPCNKIGGAEMAFNSVIECSRNNIEIVKLDLNIRNNNPLFYINGLFLGYKLIRENDIKFVVTTLWKSHFIFMILSFFMNFQIVPFIVGNRFFNYIDKIISKLVIKRANYILVDSTSGELWLRSMNNTAKIFSFLIHTPLVIPTSSKFLDCSLEYKFLYVGRLNNVKRLDKAFEFLHYLKLRSKLDIQFDLYGPIEKGFNLALYLNKYPALKISYKGIIHHHDFSFVHPNYNFFIQLSDSEGSGMSVIEAMCFGLIPVITSVGEVAKYCENGYNSILFDTMITPFNMVSEFIDIVEKIKISDLSQNAFSTFGNVINFNNVLLNSLNNIYDDEI